jgi:hypothetical protein
MPQNVLDAVRDTFLSGSAAAVARRYGFNERNVQRWTRRLPGYAILGDKTVQHAGARPGPAPAMDPVLEKAWADILRQERHEGGRTTHTWALRVMGVLAGDKLLATEARLRGMRARLQQFQEVRLSLRKVSVLKPAESSPAVVLDTVRATLIDGVCQRSLLGLESKASLSRVILNDEMSFAFEVLVPKVYEFVGVPHAWVRSKGFDKMTFTVIFWFTAAGDKLCMACIFPGQHGKQLAKQAKSWQDELCPRNSNVLFFFRKPAWMDSAIYLDLTLNIRKTWDQRYGTPELPSPTLLLGHDQARPHIAQKIQEPLHKLGILTHIVRPTKLLQVLDVGLARSIRSGFSARLFSYFWEHPDEEEMSLPDRRKLCVQLLSETWEQDISSELIQKISTKVGWVALDGSEDNLPNVSVAQTPVDFAACRTAGLAKATQLKQSGTHELTKPWELDERQSQVNALGASLRASRKKRKPGEEAAAAPRAAKRAKPAELEEDAAEMDVENEDEEPCQKAFDVDEAELTPGTTIVFVFPPEEHDVVPFRIGDIVKTLDDEELLKVHYRGFNSSAKVRGRKCTPYNATYRLVWNDQSQDGKGERQSNQQKAEAWIPLTASIELAWIWGVVDLGETGKLSQPLQTQLREQLCSS